MEHNFSGLIARTEGLSGEPLLTQWLAYILRQPVYQNVLIPFFAGVEVDCAGFRNLIIRDEEEDGDGNGIPDIEIDCEALALIVENKFDAGMTKNQPVGYLQILRQRRNQKKILAFLAPAWRKEELQTIVAPYTLEATGIHVRVCTWEDLADLLSKSFASSELISEFSRDVLRRCRVQSPITVNELTMASDVLAQWLNQRELLKVVWEKLQLNPMFKGMRVALEAKPEWDEEHCYMGILVSTSADEWVFWIGFWNLLQRKDRNATPLLAHVYETDGAKKLFPKFWSSLKELRAANIVSALVPDHGWPIPVPVASIQGKSVREQAENVVAYSLRALQGDTRTCSVEDRRDVL